MPQDTTRSSLAIPSTSEDMWENKGNGELVLKKPEAARPKPQSLEALREQLQEQYGIKPE